MARKKIILTPEEEEFQIQKRIDELLTSEKLDLIRSCERGFVPTPTRFFEKGEEVVNGAHLQTSILDYDLDKKIYLINHDYLIGPGSRDSEKKFQKRRWVLWVDLDKKKDYSNTPVLSYRDDMYLTYYQSTLSSFHSIVYYFGVDLNPDYQRDFVWTLEDKQKLIDSIFNNVDIGKFVLIKRPYSSVSHMFEILDGKQRLSAIMDFWEDRFEWNGIKFSDLHPYDKSHFENYKISKAEIDMPKDKNVLYNFFLRLNTSGKPIDKKHLEKVKSLIK